MAFDPNVQVNWYVNSPGDATPNSALLIRQEFENVYNLMKAITPIGKIEIFDSYIPPSASFPWFCLCQPEFSIAREFDSAIPNYTGWSSLVDYWRAKRITIIEDPELGPFSLFPVEAHRDVLITLDDVQGTTANLLGAINEHMSSGADNPVAVFFTDGTSEVEIGERTIDSASPVNRQLSLSIEPPEGIVDGTTHVGIYTRRIVDEPNSALHFPMNGRAFHGPNRLRGNLDFVDGLLRRDHFQGWQPLETNEDILINEGNGFSEGVGLSIGTASQGFFDSGHGEPRVGRHTHSPSYSPWFYIFGGSKTDS